MDGDSILEMNKDTFDESEVMLTEDLLCFRSIDETLFVDLGYYGKSEKWGIFVVKNNDWESPLEYIECNNLLSSIAKVQELLHLYQKHT
ncbi:hypothetical protein [Shewanella waksmanii]|uniref:hypothetical protein n=1 Tax=Shewanella waksmanii TaxID=213783 RepID=UPI00048D4649|nr:hypothetical protein [Shewanella waksmanii]